MALNLATLRTRSLTAVVFVVVMLAGLLWNFTAFFILFSIIQFCCWLEYLKLVERICSISIDNFIKWYFAFCGFVLMAVFGLRHTSYDSGLTIAGVTISLKLLFWAVLFIGLIAFVFQNKMFSPRNKWIMFGGFLYIALPVTALIYLRDDYVFLSEGDTVVETGKAVVCVIVFSIWINDTMAYIVGSLIGKTPFSKISPKKTWEGTAGGALLCILVISLIAYLTRSRLLPVKDAAIIAALCAIFGTMGDLFESKLKRMAGVKDSGSIMPGHGGFLDRFDSLLFAAPVVWLYVKLLM